MRTNVTRQLAYYLFMSVLIALLGGFLFTVVWSRVSEDTGVLLFFIGFPLVVGASFMLVVVIAHRLFNQVLSRHALRTAGLLAAALAGILVIGIPQIIVSVRTALSDATINLVSSLMVIGIWVAALLISSVLFSIMIRRERIRVVAVMPGNDEPV